MHDHLFDDVIEESVDDLFGFFRQHGVPQGKLVLHALRIIAGDATSPPHPFALQVAQGRLFAFSKRKALPIARGAFPLRMSFEKGANRRIAHPHLHRTDRQHPLCAFLVETHHRIVKHNVRVVDLPGKRVGPVGPHRKAAAGHDPAEEAVAHVLRVQILPFIVVGLLADYDRVDKADLLKGFVPLQNAVSNRTAKPNRHGLFDVENDRLFRVAK